METSTGTAVANTSMAPAPRKNRRIWRIVLGLLESGLLLVVVLAVAGFTYEFLAHRRDLRRFTREGELVDVGGHHLNLVCTGQGGTTVILESGMGVPAAGWKLVQPEVANFARVCSYDRAGYGWSDPGPLPRTALQDAHELHVLLHHARVAPPYVLVGHSLGGYLVRVYHHEYPDEVAGVVLVDSCHEDEKAHMSTHMLSLIAQGLAQMQRQQAWFPVLARLGITRLFLNSSEAGTGIPADVTDELSFLNLQRKQLKATIDEANAFDTSGDEVRQSGDFGNKPLIVLTAGKDSAADFPPAVTRQEWQEYHYAWVYDLQVRLAHLSTQGKQVVVPESGHMIPLEAPGRVIQAVQEVSQAVAQR